MPSSLLLFLLLFLAKGPTFGLGQEKNVITLLSDENKLLILKEIRKGQKYLLHPNPVIESAQVCSFCPRKSNVILSIRFWQKKDLTLARKLLMTQGWCRKQDPCRVGPYQTKRILLRDNYQQWETLTPSTLLPGVLLPKKRITILPMKGAAVNVSTLTPNVLTAFRVSFVSSTAVREEKRRLTITGQDVQWALQILKLPDARLIDGASLRKLSTWLLKAKTQDLSEEQLPALLARLEKKLTVSSMFFRPGMEHLLPEGYRAKDGEQLFVRWRISVKEKIEISFAPSSSSDSFQSPETLTSELRISEKFKLYAMPTKSSIKRPVAMLKRLDEQMSLVLNRLDQSESERQVLKEEVMRLKNTLNVTNSESNIVLLSRQVYNLAAVTNSSHLLNIETMDLKAISDCFEINQKKLPAGIYFLTPLKRAVECTEEGDLVALSRRHGNIDFNASWLQFEKGLGDVRNTDHFIGLKNLSALTQMNDMCMTLLLMPWGLQTTAKRATYDTFRISPKEDSYRLSYTKYKGTLVFDALSVSNEQKFSTFDADHDNFVRSCAKRFKSANWYNSCAKCNIFGAMSNDSSGMCCTGLERSQGEMCSPLASIRMLLRSKSNAGGSRHIVFSTIAKDYRGVGGSCTAKMELFTVPATGEYTVTVGGAAGGTDDEMDSQPGGRGASLKARFVFKKGARLAAVAGCPGGYSKIGGDASWLISLSERMLLAVAGGGGGAAEKGANYFFPPGLHGRSTPEGGDSWWKPYSPSPSARSILLLDKVGVRAKGWADLRDRLLTTTSGDFRSSGAACSNGQGGGGGGGYEGGIGCGTDYTDGGGGGGSLCSAAEAKACDISEGGNTRGGGFIIIEQDTCF